MNPDKTTVILGGPGCGKTHRLMQIVEEALVAGISPRKIGFFSFTKKAAEEGRSRACEKFGLPPEEFDSFRTIHSLAFRHLGLRRDSILGWPHLRELGRMLGIDFKGKQVEDGDVYGMNAADRLLFLEGLARNKKLPLKKVWEDAFEDSVDWFELERFANALAQFKKSRRLLDFNDMVEKFVQSDPRTIPSYDLLLIDEAQDNSSLNWDAIELLAAKAKSTYIVGDDRQSIYTFSGANVGKFINCPGKQITLEKSHRVPSAPHSLAKSLADRISTKRPGAWLPRDGEGQVNWFGNIDEIDLSKGDWLILARNGYLLSECEDYCLTQGFSFNSVSRDPLKSPALEAIRAWESLRRGKEESAEKVLHVLKFLNPRIYTQALQVRLKAEESSSMFFMNQLQEAGLKATPIWHECFTKMAPREHDFFTAAARRREPLLKTPRIKISTIHAAKGGEASGVVLLTDMSLRCRNNMQEDMDSELRVWFVAASRCKESLNLISPRTNLCFEF